jgi:hypothetical protein
VAANDLVLSLLPKDKVAEFLRWAEVQLDAQPEEFRNRFRPRADGAGLPQKAAQLTALLGIQTGDSSRQNIGGVEYLYRGKLLNARKLRLKIIVAFQTPKLLMQSGIRDRAYFEKFDIRVVHHMLGVGGES